MFSSKARRSKRRSEVQQVSNSPTPASIKQQTAQKTLVAIEKAAVTLSRGFRSEAHGSSGEGQQQAYPPEGHDAEELDWVLRKAVFTFRADSKISYRLIYG